MSLDRELTDTYSLLVVVSDQGQPLSNSASATITIKVSPELLLLYDYDAFHRWDRYSSFIPFVFLQVLDQNDNPPVILFPAPGSNAQIVVSYMEEVKYPTLFEK